jgi:hypothetical protein
MFVKSKKVCGGLLKINICILFHETSHEELHLDKWSLVQ